MLLLYGIRGIPLIDGFCTRGDCRRGRKGQAVLTRLPVRPNDGGDGAAEPVSETGAHSDGLPRCAGDGVEETKAWVCRTCRDALCVGDGVAMPGARSWYAARGSLGTM